MHWFKSNKQTQKRFTRVFFSTDIHGSEPCFLKFLKAADFYQADVLVMGGDITGKQIVTIEKNDNRYHAYLFGQEWVANSEEELDKLESQIKSNGYYPYVVTPEEKSRLQANPSEVEALFSRIMSETLTRWVHIAEERFRGSAVKCFISPGNDDHFDVDKVLRNSDVVICPDSDVVDLDGNHTMASCGYANMTPWHCPRDLEEDELHFRLETLLEELPDKSHCIFNFHAPPYDSTLDIAPELDSNLKAVMVGGQPHMISVGSKAVREMIEKYQPIVGLHGHIHECRGAIKIGRTLCVNPGSEYSEGILRGVLIHIADGKLLSYQFVTG